MNIHKLTRYKIDEFLITHFEEMESKYRAEGDMEKTIMFDRLYSNLRGNK